MGLFPFIFVLRNFRAEAPKNVPKQEFRGSIWLIGWLCERAVRSRITIRKEGQVKLFGKTPKQPGAMRCCRKFLAGQIILLASPGTVMPDDGLNRGATSAATFVIRAVRAFLLFALLSCSVVSQTASVQLSEDNTRTLSCR